MSEIIGERRKTRGHCPLRLLGKHGALSYAEKTNFSGSRNISYLVEWAKRQQLVAHHMNGLHVKFDSTDVVESC